MGAERKVVNHCGNLALMMPHQLDQVFGPSIKVMIWRDPRAVYVSSKAVTIRKKKRKPVDAEQFCEEYQWAYGHYAGEPRHLWLQFETLVADPEPCMRRLAAAIGIDFSDILLAPTLFGEPTGANTSFQRSFGAIDATAANEWASRIDRKERRIIELKLGQIIHEHYQSRLPEAA